MFPADLQGHTFTVEATSEVRARTEIERREKYFTQLEEKIPNGQNHPLTVMARQCLDNAPSSRPEVSCILHTLQKIDFEIEDYENKRLNVIEAFTMLAHKVYHQHIMITNNILTIPCNRKRMKYRSSVS